MKGTSAGVRALFTDWISLAGAALVLLLLGALGWFLLATGDVGKAKSREGTFTHIHCPECLDEAPYSPSLVRKSCVSCGKGLYVPTIGSVKAGESATGRSGRLLLLLLVAIVLFQGLAFLAIRRLQSLHKAEEEVRNRKLLCRCPYCGRRLTYPLTRVGTGVVCCQCKTAYVLPDTDQAETEKNE